jgi:23S rRNA pseudouridine1911/1915/1917 synthase
MTGAHDDADARSLRVDLEPELLSERALAAALRARVVGVVASGERGVRRGVLDRVVDAADDADHAVLAAAADAAGRQGADEAVHALAALGGAQLARVRLRDRGHRVGREEPRLEEARETPELEALGREMAVVEPEGRDRLAAERALPGDVVDGEDRRDGRREVAATSRFLHEVERGARSPVVAVDDLERSLTARSLDDDRRDGTREGRPARRVAAVRAIEAPRHVDQEQIGARPEAAVVEDDLGRRPDPAAENERREAAGDEHAGPLDRGKTWERDRDAVAQRAKRLGERGDHVRGVAAAHHRRELATDEENVHGPRDVACFTLRVTRLRAHELERPVQRPDGIADNAVVTVLRVPPEASGMRVDRFVQSQLRRTSRTRVQAILRRSAYDDAAVPLRAGARVRAEQLVCLWRAAWDEVGDPDVEIPIVYEDDALLAVDKPPMIPVHPSARYYRTTVVKMLEAVRPGQRLHLAHRLDRETSGVLLLAKRPDADRHVKRQFQGQDPITGRFDHVRRVEKSYLAIVRGDPEADAYRVDLALRPDENPLRVKMRVCDLDDDAALTAATRVEVLGRRRDAIDGTRYALVRCHLETGRQHQIRVHLAATGTPVLGDKLYGGLDDDVFRRSSDGNLTADDLALLVHPRHALHAERLELIHPERGERFAIEAPLTEDLRAFWAELGGEAPPRARAIR